MQFAKEHEKRGEMPSVHVFCVMLPFPLWAFWGMSGLGVCIYVVSMLQLYFENLLKEWQNFHCMHQLLN